ncbi:RecE family exodeoxyribonuclease [Citrobacter portucalensis]|uniref:RecE family exodeoxyribonuclease n=1 Tax=Citrobacter portucalensis TaxID=1639133 RepID=UPI00388FB87B
MEFFYVVKATQKSGKQDAVVWFTAKTEARANLQLDVALEDAGIETGRGKDYAKPIRTDFPVYNDLPEEGEVDFTWCDRYELAEDQRTWNVKQQAEDESVDDADIEDSTAEESQQSEQPNLIVVATLPFRQRVLAQFIGDGEYLYHVDAGQKNEIVRLEMDTDNAYAQNLLLAAENVEAFKKAIEHDIHKVVNAVKKVFPVDGKRPELATVIQFLTVWFKTDYIDRGLLVKEWQKGNRVAQIQRTDVKTNAGGGNKTDRNTDYVHTLDTLDVEIALATLPMDFNIYDIPGGVYRRAKEIVRKKESPFSEWSEALRKTAGILDYSRAAIFALIRGTSSELVNFPGRLRAYINANLTENDHSTPSEETLADAGHAPDVSWENEVNEQVAAEQKTAAKQPQIANMGNGVFSIDGLMGDQQTHTDDRSPVNEDTTSNVQMEEAVSDEEQAGNEVQSGESSLETGEESHTGQQADVNQNTDSVAQNSDSVNQTEPVSAQTEPETQSDEPAVVYPAYFEPGRYEGLPNEVYHAANGISSTQVKDARVSLMYFNARHVAKTITKERSPVLDMGNLVHGLALQPEQLDEEFSVEPVIPEGAFTTTATIRAFIDEHNASLPALLSADDIKALLEEYNATLPPQVPLGASLEETGQSYMALPAEFQRIEDGQKQTAAAMKACIKEYNATLPPQVPLGASLEETGQSYMALPAEFQRIEDGQKQTAAAMKACIKEYNATLPPQVPLGASLEETGQSYMALPAEFQRIEDGQKQTAAAMKACIKEYNATLPPQVKTSGSRDALLEQLAIINPDLVAQEAQKPQPLKVSGTKSDLIQAVKSVNPDAVFADELLDAWRENPQGKVLVTRQQLSTALAIQKALLQHPTAGMLLQHPSRAVEVSYFGFDDETGLEVRVRPDLEIDLDGVRIGADLKTISMWNIKQEGLRAKLHREIIDRDYHLSAAMYCETAALDQFFWIFVNKDENYHWIAIIEASAELLELGMLEYRKAMRAIATGFDTGEWPAPITADYTDELNDFDLRRLEALRLA